MCVIFAHPAEADFFRFSQLIHAETVLDVSHYFGKIYLLKYLVECLIFKKVVLVSELNFSYNSALTAFELCGIFGTSALNVVSK